MIPGAKSENFVAPVKGVNDSVARSGRQHSFAYVNFCTWPRNNKNKCVCREQLSRFVSVVLDGAREPENRGTPYGVQVSLYVITKAT